ncbi:SIR2 family NAD-dependent protein deacylase [Gynuella sp.]|uniref:SIR2 family NAD-dependent protein deacylase n=1 Tax=Gynuella sp. TaxID=2969146 RepID=UPI003D0C445C
MKDNIERQKVVVFSGAGISAESGLKTFRDSDGLWENHSIHDVATPEAWLRNPELVLRFYNERRRQLETVQPNSAHLAIAALERAYDVFVITQNVDNLHERAGSSTVLHLHGELTKARSTADEALVYEIGSKAIELGDQCEHGSQLRPHIVWFGEIVSGLSEAAELISQADKIIVVGTSLEVEPAASLVHLAPAHAEKVVIALNLRNRPAGFEYYQERAGEAVPKVCQRWLEFN